MLTQLVGDVIDGNLQLQIARQKLLEARADRTIAASQALPQIGAGAAGSANRSSQTLSWPPGIGYYRSYAFGLDASWELDVFGGIRRQTQAAEADIQATIEERRAILVALLAETATDYAELRATQLRLDIARHNLGIAQRALDLTSTEFERGLTTSLAVSQARAQMESVEATVPVLQAQQARLIHAISVLTGRFPGQLETQLDIPAPIVPAPPILPLTLPSEVVANRPDIRNAERALQASTARIGVAVSNLYPHFNIPMLLTPATSFPAEAFEAVSLTWQIGLRITQNIYQGGRLRAQIDEAKAAAEIDRITYRQTVLNAFREVEDALINLQSETRRLASLRASLKDSQAASDQAERLYAAGLTDFLNVLSTDRTLFAAEDEVALSELAYDEQVITLYQSLGGGWQAVTFGDEK